MKQGFLNLSGAEQERILKAALDEFAEREYSIASLNRIIQNAGISKGSMYHYFENKESLYLAVLEKGIEMKAKYLKDALARLNSPISRLSFFDKLSFQLQASAQFAKEHPQYQAMNTHLQTMTDSPLKRKVWERFYGKFDQFVEVMVNQAMEASEIRQDLDKEFVVRLLRFFLLRFFEFYQDQSFVEEEMQSLISFLKDGLVKKG